MAKARLLHKSISVSLQVNKLSLPAKLIFTWMIPHTDDQGRLKGEPEYIKATVVPIAKWSFRSIKTWLNEIKNAGLIYYWEQNGNWFIEFVKWNDYQTVRKDRLIPSNLPSFNKESDNQVETIGQPEDNQKAPQYNVIEDNRIEVNKSEDNVEQTVADKYPSNGTLINPKTFEPSSKEESAALDVWTRLEPNNPLAFKSTYLKAVDRGLPADLSYQFASEIKQDPTIKNPGAIFNKKVEQYFEERKPQ